MGKFLQKKKIVLLGVIVVIILVVIFVGDFIFGGKGDGLFGEYQKAPSDPVQRIAWLSENIDNMDHEKFISLDYKVPSWKELDKINKSLPSKRNYPNYIKAVQTYGTLPNLVEVLYFGDVLKDLGVNTQFIHANYWYRNGKFKLWYLGYKIPKDLSQDESKRALVHNILLAKQQGLAVILFPDYFQLEDGGMEKLGISDDLEEHLERIVLDLAEIAEEYNIEYLVPVNQIEMILDSNGYSVEEAQQRTNAYYASVVPKIRKVYSGKILYKMGGFGRWNRYEEISLEGADLFGFTGCYNTNRDDPDFMVSDIKESSVMASKLSKKYGIPWINAEFVVSSDDIYVDPKYNNKKDIDYPIESYYKAGLNAFNTYAQNASGFTVHSLLGSGKVYDTPAFPLIKTFFAGKK